MGTSLCVCYTLIKEIEEVTFKKGGVPQVSPQYLEAQHPPTLPILEGRGYSESWSHGTVTLEASVRVLPGWPRPPRPPDGD